MRNWSKNLSRAALVAVGAVALGTGASVGVATAGTGTARHEQQTAAKSVDIEQVQFQGGSGATLHGCGDLGGIFTRANVACSLNGSSDGDDDLGLDWVSTMGGTFNGPIRATGDALALVNIAKSYGSDYYPSDEQSSCNSCNADDYDDYGSEDVKSKPYKSKPYKAKKAKKTKKVKAYKAHKAKAHKAHKSKSYKAKPRKAKHARSKRFRVSPQRGYAWYAQPGTPLPSTRRLAVVRPAPESAVRVAARPETAAAVEPQAAERGIRAFLTKLVKPAD